MPVRQTIQIGHPALKAENKVIKDFGDSKLKGLIQDLTDTMRDSGLVGMAAPQIAQNLQVFITEPRESKFRPKQQADQLRVYINPTIVHVSNKQVEIYEGCGSVVEANLFGPVIRPQAVTVEAFDENGRKFRLTADGLLGRVIQHEQDHMIGVEFLEKVSDYKRLINLEHYLAQIKDNPINVKNSENSIKEIEYL